MGTIWDRNLKWSEHIETIKTKLQKKNIGCIIIIIHFLNEKVLYLIFNSLLWAMLDMACCAGGKQIKNVKMISMFLCTEHLDAYIIRNMMIEYKN